MNIFVFSDESGVFDRKHNDYFVFGGVLFLDKEDKDNQNRKYLAAEKSIRSADRVPYSQELKASFLTAKNKRKLYRSINRVYKFGAVVDQKRILPQIFEDKKSKQRYLDFAYKLAVRRAFEALIKQGRIDPNHVEDVLFFVDEHSTATNGKYELREAIENELKIGTFNQTFDKHFPPLFRGMRSVQLTFCNSEVKPLVRASDIVANYLYHEIVSNNGKWISPPDNFFITYLP